MGLLDSILGVGAAARPVVGGITAGLAARRAQEQEDAKAALEARFKQQQIAKSIEEVRQQREKEERETIGRENNQIAYGDYSRMPGNEGTPVDASINWTEKILEARKPKPLTHTQEILNLSPQDAEKYGKNNRLMNPLAPREPRAVDPMTLSGQALVDYRKKKNALEGKNEEGLTPGQQRTQAHAQAKAEANILANKVLLQHDRDANKTLLAIGPLFEKMAKQPGVMGLTYQLALDQLMDTAANPAKKKDEWAPPGEEPPDEPPDEEEPPPAPAPAPSRAAPAATAPVVRDQPTQQPRAVWSPEAIALGRQLKAKGLKPDSIIKLVRKAHPPK